MYFLSKKVQILFTSDCVGVGAAKYKTHFLGLFNLYNKYWILPETCDIMDNEKEESCSQTKSFVGVNVHTQT